MSIPMSMTLFFSKNRSVTFILPESENVRRNGVYSASAVTVPLMSGSIGTSVLNSSIFNPSSMADSVFLFLSFLYEWTRKFMPLGSMRSMFAKILLSFLKVSSLSLFRKNFLKKNIGSFG